MSRPTVEERFWAKVQRGDPDECWPWTAAAYRRGYGHFTLPGNRHITATRFALQLELGRPLTVNEVACHGCDNPVCTNPTNPGGRKHLFVGSYSDNSQDMVAKGRHVAVPQPGSANGRARLTEEQVLRIRLQHAAGEASATALALVYQVSTQTIYSIVNYKTWGHLAPPRERAA